MADINKAIKPIENVRIAPLNDGTLYQANKEIVFRLGLKEMVLTAAMTL